MNEELINEYRVDHKKCDPLYSFKYFAKAKEDGNQSTIVKIISNSKSKKKVCETNIFQLKNIRKPNAQWAVVSIFGNRAMGWLLHRVKPLSC